MGWLPGETTGPSQDLLEWLHIAEPAASGVTGQAWFQWLVYSLSGGDPLAQPGSGPAFTAMQSLMTALEQPIGGSQGQQSQTPAKPSTADPYAQAGRTYVRGGIPSNVDPAVVDAVLRAAQDTNVPFPLALAIIQQESGFNPNAHHVSDTENSWGVAQLNTMGGEGAGVPQYILQDPYQNAKIAFTRVRQVMNQNPNADWGTIAALAQRPGDPSGYAASINGSIDQIQTGQGAMGWGLSTIRTGDPTFESNAEFGQNSVPQPFAAGYFSDISQSFGQNGEEGTDFAMPQGQEISTPVGGTIQLRDDGKANWGKAVYVKMPNGWTFFVGHMHQFSVTDGQTVGPGDVLGVSGGNVNDPSSGDSTGDHIEVRFIDPSGKNQDPMPFLQQIYSGNGTTFQQWMGGIFAGSANPAPQKQNIVVTPDGAAVDLNTQQGAWYKTVDSAWTSIYGIHAPLQAALDFQNAGITTTDALTNAINNMPSSIPGVTIGSFKNVSDAAQSAAMSAFGRSIPQSLIQQFFQQGITSKDDMQLWFDTHSSADIPKADYQAIYDAAQPYSQQLSGDVPHPTDVSQMYQQAQNAG